MEKIICEWECLACERVRATEHPADATIQDLERKRPEICLCEETEFRFVAILVMKMGQ